MVDVWKTSIPELTDEETRNVYVYLPESYYEDEQRHYPVLYMFDGHNVFFDSHATFGKCWGMKEFMDFSKTQMIIAAVECNHSPDNGRLREYSPFTFKDPKLGKITGLGNITMNWMAGTLKHEIDSRYRTLPDREHTFIAGSSMGGLMSLYAVIEYNSVYSGAAALSPSVWVATAALSRLIQNSDIRPDTVIYMDYGSKELRQREGMDQKYIKIVSQLMKKQAFVTSRIIPGGTHCEASWEKQIPFFMNTLLYRP